jgi:transcriptional regulator with XRE-family HTH domain
MSAPSDTNDIARPAKERNNVHRYARMESAFIAAYDSGMPTDIAVLLGGALRELRLRTTRTQDEWAAQTGMSQSYLSAVERGRSGWESFRNIATAIEAVGADPVELLRIAAAPSEEERELLALWHAAPERQRTAILTLLRAAEGAHTAAR